MVDGSFCCCFFKQKTAYEIKECDWSSDVCSSDLVDVHVDLVHRHAGVFGGGFDDPNVGLVRNEQVDVGGGESGARQGAVAGVRHRQHGGLEHLAARHLDVVAVILEQLFA